MFGLNSVVAINKFASDNDDEIKLLEDWAKENNVKYGLSEAFLKGGEGAKDLAQLVVDNIDNPTNFNRLYENKDDNQLKI